MPIFDVLTINQKHLALVNIAKQKMNDNDVDSEDKTFLATFPKWRNYITKQLKMRTSLTSTTIEHIFE